MRRTRITLVAVVAAAAVVLLGAGTAAAATRVIDAADTGPEGHRWVPPTLTIDTGDTVEWQFDQATLPHNVKSTSANWSIDSPIETAQGPAQFTFTEPGTYTFLCEVHPINMTGAVTVVDPGEPAGELEKVLVFSKTAGFRHDSIPQGIAAIQALGAANDFAVDATEDAAAFTDANLAQYDVVTFLSTTGDVLDGTQQAAFERYIQAGGGFAGVHAASDTEYTWPWYGQMLGGYFRNHPAGTPTATVRTEDGDEPSTTGIPTPWTRTDEWYNFQNPVNPVVNGGGNDYSPRAAGVKVLATVDESTYAEDDGNATDDDHPVVWCSDFDGGRAWYTAMGHTQASFGDADFRRQLLGGLRTAAGATADCGAPRQSPPGATDFEKVTLDDDTANPMEMDIAPDGRVFYIERDGRLMVWKPDTGTTVQAGAIPVTQSQENGLIGLQLAPSFATTGHVYLTYSALPDASNQNRLSRFTVQGDAIVAGSEQIIFTWQHQRAECCHTSGSIAFAPDGSLYIATGDNTNPFDSSGFAPIDERAGRSSWDAQRTSANTNNPNGKILHIVPRPNAAGAPGIGTTYDIPGNNLFPVGTAQTLPEIYAMGFRNPFRITVDPKTGWVLMGDYGPDAGSTNPNRGPQGSVEYNVVKEAGNYGWPYCIRQNVAYNDYDFATSTSGPKFNCDAPVNNSPNNTGLVNLPPAKPATMWMGYGETDARFPLLGTGGAPTGGPRYDYDADLESDTKFPPYYDGKWFIGEWNNGWIKTASLDDAGAATTVDCWITCTNAFPGGGYLRPMDMEFGPDGSLYVIEWGSGFGGNNADSGIYRIDYTKGARKPIAHAAASPDSGPVPLEVEFSSAGSTDPEGTPLTYEWDFDGNGTTDSTDANPVHTYQTAGNFSAKLTVTDQSGATGTDTIPIIAGNSRPQVTIEIPENGKIADFGDVVPYRITVTDAEDGSTAGGTISCADVTLNISLGHDQHAHELAEKQGCEGTFETSTDGGHGAEANIFTVIEATYTDEGAGAAGAVTGRAEAILQPKLKQAEYWSTTGKTADGRGIGDPGIVNEATTDTGGGQSAAFIEDGDWISFNPYNLEDLDSVRFRVASAGAGGIIELRTDAADGPLVAATPNIPPTGGWQTWTNVDLDLGDVPQGTHRLFVVFRHPTATGSLLNLNWFRFSGKGAAVSAPPVIGATATPATGEAPLEVAFDGTATDPDAEAGEQLTYKWDFGVAGNADTADTLDATYTYERAGSYTATLLVTDPKGAKATTTVEVKVTNPPSECPADGIVDEFDGTALGAAWSVIRQDQNLVVGGGSLQIPAAPGDIYGGQNDAKNLVLRDMPSGAWTATVKLNYEGTSQYHQAGLMVYADDANFTKFGRLSTNAAGNGDEKFEFIWEDGGNPRNEAADSTANLPASFPKDYWARIVSDGTNITGEYSTDGTTWVPVGRPAPITAGGKIGLFAFSNAGTGNPIAAFDSFALTGENVGGGGGGTPTGPSRDDEFTDGTLDKDRWNAIVRDTPAEYTLAGGKLNITTSPGDIYTGDSTPPPNNFILQSADHAGADWVIETKIDGATINGGYGQGGLMAYQDGDNYVKFDAISDVDNPRINRLELRSETAGAIGPNPADPLIAAGVTEIWLRLTKTGTSYSGEYSLDGVAWTALATPVTNAMAAPRFGLFAFGPQAPGQGDLVPFEYFTLDGADTGECSCTAGAGDDFDGTSLDKERWNSIRNEDTTKYVVADGGLKVTTVSGDVRDTAPNFFLQTADHAGADWELETKLSGTIVDGYQQGGITAFGNGANFVKLNAISDVGNTRINRIELRSQVNGSFVNPQPNIDVPAGTTDIWLRLTKAGTSYSGQYSYDGVTWTSVGNAVANAVADPAFGLYTVGVNAEGGTVTFDHFKVDGKGGCDGGEPDNAAPVLGDVAAAPTAGFAPLPVDFTAAATDADEDELTYSWDFGDGGTSGQEDPSHTYATAGTYDAEVTVSDGEKSASKTVQVTVLGADDPEARFRVLVFSRTTGFRHDSIDEGIAAVKALGDAHDFQVDASEDASLFRDGVLSHYDTVVFLSTTGDPLDEAQQAAFERYVRAGGGYTGVHAAADTEYDWTWYGRLVGGYFLGHPPGTPAATVHIEDQDHPSTEGIATPWQRSDEWYNYKSPLFASPEVPDGDFSPRPNVHVLATVDEATYDEQDGTEAADDHPISWCQRYDGGRSWYTGMGHTAASFAEAPFLAHLLGGIEVSAGAVEDAACGVEPAGDGPVVQAFADPSTGTAPLQVNFSATGIDPDGGEIAEYRWTFSDGGSFLGSSVSRTFTTAGEYTGTVAVKDDEGTVTTKEVKVTVTGTGRAPEIVEAVADRTTGPAPLDVLFQAVADDPDGDRLTYKWEFGDQGTAFGAEAEHRYLTKGTYEAKLTVSDPAGNTDTATIAIAVSDPVGNASPTVEAAAVPQSGSAPLDVQFSATGTDPDGDALTYTWSFGDGSADAAGRRARHVYTGNGVFTATVTATDRAGNTDTDTIAITVGNPAGNQAPTVAAAADPASGTGPLKVNFSAAANDPDGDAVSYVWDFGDTGKGAGAQVSHTYAAAGTYTATVTVTDAGGKTGTATVTITVAAPVGVAGAPSVKPDAAAKTALRSVSVPSLAGFRKRGVKVAATCGGDGTAAAALWASKATARRLGLTSRGLGRTTVQCAAGKTVTVRLKPTRKVRRAIKAKRPSSLRVTIALALRDGAAVRRTITIAR